MLSPRPPSPVRTTKLNTSRLAAFNARRRNQVRTDVHVGDIKVNDASKNRVCSLAYARKRNLMEFNSFSSMMSSRYPKIECRNRNQV